MNTLTVVIFSAAVTLIYAGVKDVDPRDVVKSVLKGEVPKSDNFDGTWGGKDTYIPPSGLKKGPKVQKGGTIRPETRIDPPDDDVSGPEIVGV